MDMTKLTETLQETLGSSLPGILGALGILIIGWVCRHRYQGRGPEGTRLSPTE